MSSTKKFFIPLVVFLLFGGIVCPAQGDSTILAYDTFLANILAYHPVAKQADLKLQAAAAEGLAARGNFDPVLSSGWNQKNFDDKLYYRQFQNKLQIPTRIGADIVGGYEQTSGVFLNPENKTDAFGLWNVGVEVNVLQGLLVDERRTALKQAKVFQSLAENEKQILLNELLYAASLAYLEWQKNYYLQKVIEESYVLANTYFENTKLSFSNGEKSAIDTLEALLIFQEVNALLRSGEAGVVKAKQELENYLWFGENPVALLPTTLPENFAQSILPPAGDEDVTALVANHPQILEKQNKQIYLELEQRLKREKLKPKLKLKYNPLLSTRDNSFALSYSAADYKWGFDFSMPLLLRSERANIQQGRIKLSEVGLELENKKNELQNKLEASLQQQSLLREQLTLQQQNIAGYRQLLEAENEKFLLGESSVFLLNKRQEKFLDGRLKWIELNNKYQKELLQYRYYSNRLN